MDKIFYMKKLPKMFISLKGIKRSILESIFKIFYIFIKSLKVSKNILTILSTLRWLQHDYFIFIRQQSFEQLSYLGWY